MTDAREMIIIIEALRQELYQRYIDKKCIDTKMIEISQRLDVLIVDYIKEMSKRHKKQK